jgi:hypothetical protein
MILQKYQRLYTEYLHDPINTRLKLKTVLFCRRFKFQLPKNSSRSNFPNTNPNAQYSPVILDFFLDFVYTAYRFGKLNLEF